MSDNAYPILCPNLKCKVQIHQNDIREILGDEYSNYEQYEIKKTFE
jgi:hypothetical protein